MGSHYYQEYCICTVYLGKKTANKLKKKNKQKEKKKLLLAGGMDTSKQDGC